jgi:aminopeptidase N
MSDADGSPYNISITVPEKYEAISIGDLAGRTVEGEKATYRFRFSDKTSMATVVIGKFRHHKDAVDGLDLDVAFPDSVWTAKKKDQEKSILTVLYNCFKIYTKLYGPPRYKKLTASECTFGHGRGFPTLLLISALVDPGDAQYYGADMVLDQALVSHETGHQWWGNIVEPLTYRDSWISEATAELASYDYAMVIYGPNKVRDALAAAEFNLDGLLAYNRKPTWMQGPICMGSRLATTLEPRGGYQTIVYNKGAWALVNLRKVAVASPAGSMQAFYNGLQDFLKTYTGRMATTQDFQKIMERHLRMELGWFFDQYFRRIEIPNVTVKARAEKAEGGWRIVAEGQQDTDFRLYIPIQYTLGDKTQEVVFRMDGKQGKQEFPVTGKPSSIKVDPINETLARVKS